MFFSSIRRCGYIAAALVCAMQPAPAAAVYANFDSAVHPARPAIDVAVRPLRLASIQPAGFMGGLNIPAPPRRLNNTDSLGGFQIASLSPEVLTCDVSWLNGCTAPKPGAAEQPQTSSPPAAGCAESCGLLNETAIKSNPARPCLDQPWDNCGRVEELPGGRQSSVKVDEVIDRMVSDHKAATTPYSTFTPRTVGYHVPKGQIVILTSERRLLYFFQDDIAHEFAIGVARRNLQRLGSTQVTLKRRDPIWVPTALQHRVYRHLPASVGPGPKNPLGTRALNLNIPNIRIHGTNDDKSIGEALSDGCFHMYNRDIEYLFEIVAVGAKVTILR